MTHFPRDQKFIPLPPPKVDDSLFDRPEPRFRVVQAAGPAPEWLRAKPVRNAEAWPASADVVIQGETVPASAALATQVRQSALLRRTPLTREEVCGVSALLLRFYEVLQARLAPPSDYKVLQFLGSRIQVVTPTSSAGEVEAYRRGFHGSTRWIAWQTGLSKSTVNACLNRLREDKIVTTTALRGRKPVHYASEVGERYHAPNGVLLYVVPIRDDDGTEIQKGEGFHWRWGAARLEASKPAEVEMMVESSQEDYERYRAAQMALQGFGEAVRLSATSGVPALPLPSGETAEPPQEYAKGHIIVHTPISAPSGAPRGATYAALAAAFPDDFAAPPPADLDSKTRKRIARLAESFTRTPWHIHKIAQCLHQ